ncbi:UDP-N-acetylmuramoyl-L-alanine--D-glutamate ligase [Virgibacillus halophilus]|uniref:UDP-N-acetylmuramoyl-L-alanine--D-glutamate ligase n=1 Tax=Tigheibacillus halophilus TaxID=361280 RepID=UPI0036283832
MNKFSDFPYTNVLVLGLAKSGTAAANLLAANGTRVIVNDGNANAEDENIKELARRGVKTVVGSHPLSVLEGVELVVKNPGIKYDNPVLVHALEKSIPIVTEVELVNYLTEANIIGITGSNGKTTTTTMVTEMLRNSSLPVKVAGNIGIVASETAATMLKGENLVLELSSFQLQGTKHFRPHIAVLLNIFSAHLDYHHTLENYIAAKSRIFARQTPDDFAVYNADDAVVCEAVRQSKAEKIPFSVKRRLENGVWADRDAIYFYDEKVVDRAEIVLVGEHNLENILAAVAAAKLSGASNQGIRKVLGSFNGVKHRLQYVTTVQGRRFYNDSKATNILATSKALTAFDTPTILLAGGLDRGNGFEEMLPFLKHVKAMVLFGETAHKIHDTAVKAGIEDIVFADDITDAVPKAYALSVPKDIILLSPACASWDQYKTFEQRGDMFIQAVHTLE